jgi:predicted Zn-dependent protease
MKDKARLWVTLLAVAVATPVAAAADRFVPDPAFVVVNIRQTMPDESLRILLRQWRADPQDESATLALAQAFIERARSSREPRYFGRAEAALAPLATRAGAGVELRRLYAETLQFRHDFSKAGMLLDTLQREQPHDGYIRLQRASLRLTRGDFAGARSDCAQLVVARSALATAGVACLAESLAGSGELPRARQLLQTLAADSPLLDPALHAYLLATRAELAERAGAATDAIENYRRALRLAPADDAIRAALADVLAVQRDPRASGLLEMANPSLGLLVRRAALAGADRETLMIRAQRWLALETARGDAIHHREAALLALANRDGVAALAAARLNFRTQRELADVRVLARAAMLARDADSQRSLREWLEATGYQDVVTESILAGKASS